MLLICLFYFLVLQNAIEIQGKLIKRKTNRVRRFCIAVMYVVHLTLMSCEIIRNAALTFKV